MDTTTSFIKQLGYPHVILTPDMGEIMVPREVFANVCTTLAHALHLPLAVLFATDDRAAKKTFGVHAVFSLDQIHEWMMVTTHLPENDPVYESVSKTVMAAHWYERYAMDMFGIIAHDHPDSRRLVHHENIPSGTFPLRKDFSWNTKLEHADVPYPMHHVDGEGVYEIPVGPIHAGIIEPGHFRFNVAGERIITLEGKLFFTHKGIEKLLEGKTPEAGVSFIERVSGDMSASHAFAYCRAIESIGRRVIPPSAEWIRMLMCELERLTMHIHDLSNMGGMGTGYTIIAANGFRIKERLMRLSGRVCGNRFWRGMIIPGGARRVISAAECDDISKTVSGVLDEMRGLVRTALASDGLRERLETTGILSRAAAEAYGARGIAARASGIGRDVRHEHPYAYYAQSPFRMIVKSDGDVYARFCARWEELDVIEDVIFHCLAQIALVDGLANVPCPVASGIGIGAVESWRGELFTLVETVRGAIERCVIRDPSFCNWPLFGELGPGNIVPDFPLCNKSLNLSYSGTDL